MIGRARGRRTAASEPRTPGMRIARNMTLLSAGEVLGRTLTVITALVAARALGPTLLGEVSFAQTLAFYASSFSDGGLTLLTYRQIVLRPERLSRLLSDTTFIQLGLSFVMVALIVPIALAAPVTSGTRTLLIVFSPYAVTQALNVLYALQALEQMGSVAAVKVATQLLTAIPTIVLVLITHNPIWVAAGLVGGQFAGDAVTFALLRRSHRVRIVAPQVAESLTLLRQGLPLLGSVLLYNYAASLDIAVLGIVGTPHDVGEYSAPARLIYTAVALNQVLTTAILPELVRRYAEGRERFANFTRTLVVLTTRLTLVPTVIVVVESGPIIRTLYGAKFNASSDLLAILAIAVPLIWYSHLIGYFLIAAGSTRLYFIGLVVTAVFATVGYPLVTAALNATGTAIVAVATPMASVIAYSVLVRRRLGLKVTSQALRQLPYGLVPLGVLLGLHLAVPGIPEGAALLASLIGVVAVEAAGGWPTVRGLADIRRVRGARAPSSSSSPPPPPPEAAK